MLLAREIQSLKVIVVTKIYATYVSKVLKDINTTTVTHFKVVFRQ
jgi:hypothetical protein